jgi:hypothetical protein
MNGMNENDETPTLKIIEDEPVEATNVFIPQRLEGESFDDYKLRRLSEKFKQQSMRRGNMIWNSSPAEEGQRGRTYRKPKEQ